MEEEGRAAQRLRRRTCGRRPVQRAVAPLPQQALGAAAAAAAAEPRRTCNRPSGSGSSRAAGEAAALTPTERVEGGSSATMRRAARTQSLQQLGAEPEPGRRVGPGAERLAPQGANLPGPRLLRGTPKPSGMHAAPPELPPATAWCRMHNCPPVAQVEAGPAQHEEEPAGQACKHKRRLRAAEGIIVALPPLLHHHQRLRHHHDGLRRNVRLQLRRTAAPSAGAGLHVCPDWRWRWPRRGAG